MYLYLLYLLFYTDSFAVGEEGTILKKLQENEKSVLEQLMSDALMPFVPKYNGVVTIEADRILLHTVLNVPSKHGQSHKLWL